MNYFIMLTGRFIYGIDYESFYIPITVHNERNYFHFADLGLFMGSYTTSLYVVMYFWIKNVQYVLILSIWLCSIMYYFYKYGTC